MEHLLFKEADSFRVDQDYEFDLQETLLYESRYRELIQRSFFAHEKYKRAFLYCLVDELLLSIRTNSLTEDRKFFKSKDLDPQKSKLIYIELLFYRYENRISLLEDLHFEQTKKFIDECMVEIKNIKMVNTTYGALQEYMMNFFDVADQNSNVKTKEELIEEVKIYEARYKYIISLFGDATTELRERFLKYFKYDLLNSLSKNSICKDREYFTSDEEDYLLETYDCLLVWRYEEGVSIFDDLNLEKSEDFVRLRRVEIESSEDDTNPEYHCRYNSFVLTDYEIKKLKEKEEFYKNHPEEVEKERQRLNEIGKRLYEEVLSKLKMPEEILESYRQENLRRTLIEFNEQAHKQKNFLSWFKKKFLNRLHSIL